MRARLLAGMVVAAGSPAMASVIQIQMSGVDLNYTDADGAGAGTGTLTDAGAPTDPLNGLDFLVDGSLVGTFGAADDLDLGFSALAIPSIAAPAIGGTTSVSTAGGGAFELLIGGGSILTVDLVGVQVAYSKFGVGPSVFDILFTGAVGNVTGQSLPFGLIYGDVVQISFSLQGDATESGGFLTNFVGSGTGEVRGPLIPAPGAAGALALAGLLVARRRR